jgi:hypothetical protein
MKERERVRKFFKNGMYCGMDEWGGGKKGCVWIIPMKKECLPITKTSGQTFGGGSFNFIRRKAQEQYLFRPSLYEPVEL